MFIRIYLLKAFQIRVWITIIDAHGLKIQGRGYLMFFAKIPRGVKCFRKNCLGGPPISGFIAFLLTSVLKFAWGGYYIYPSPSPHPPVCIMDNVLELSNLFTFIKNYNINFNGCFNMAPYKIISFTKLLWCLCYVY